MAWQKMVELTHTQTKILADALERFAGEAALRQKQVAEALGVTVEVLRKVAFRGAATRISRQAFYKMAAQLKVDVSTWDVEAK